MADESGRLFVCPTLCFIFTKFRKVSEKKLVKVLTDSFSSNDISMAKNLIMMDVEKISTDKPLPRLTAHRDADLARRAQKDATDIMTLISAVDRHQLLDKLPRYVTDNTDSTPTMKLEEGELNYLMSKFDKMEDTILCLQETVNKLYATIQSLTSDTDKQTAQAVQAAQGVQLGSTDQSSIHKNLAVRPVEIMNERNTATHNAATAATQHEAASLRWDQYHPSTSSAVDSHATDTESDAITPANDFTLVRNRKSVKRRRKGSKEGNCANNQVIVQSSSSAALPGKSFSAVTAMINVDRPKASRKPLMVGCHRSPLASSGLSSKLAAAKPLLGKAVYCIDNVGVNITEVELEDYVKSLSIRVISCHEVNPRRTYKQKQENIYPDDHKTFRLCINKADSNLLLNPEVWPDDIAISAYYFKPKVTDKSANNVTMMHNSKTDTVAATPGQARVDDVDDHFDDALNLSPIAKIATAAVNDSAIHGDPSDNLITNQDGC